jgi:hypothetical protein
MADERRPVGSVAEETARLLDALMAGIPGADEVAGNPAGGDAYRNEPAPDDAAEGTVGPEAEPCPTCGHVPGPAHAAAGDGEVCHLCPVCQLLRVVRTVRPETLDRLADLAAAVTDTLRDVAASRWRETGSPPARRPRVEVQDIEIEGDAPGADIGKEAR